MKQTTWFTDWKERWEQLNKELKATDPTDGCNEPRDIVRAGDRYNYRLNCLKNSAKVILGAVRMAPYDRQAISCVGCKYAIMPEGVMEGLEAVMLGKVRCNKGMGRHGHAGLHVRATTNARQSSRKSSNSQKSASTT